MKYYYIKEGSNCHKIMEKRNFNENADLIKNLHNIQQSAQLSFQKLHFLFHYFPVKKKLYKISNILKKKKIRFNIRIL